MPDETGKVFITYSHDDVRHKERLLVHLRPAIRECQFQVWEDGQLRAGDDWHASIQDAISDAKVAIALVSASFFASEYVAQHELPALLSARDHTGLTLIPVVVGVCDYSASPLRGIQAINSPDKPLDKQSRAERDQVWLGVVHRVKEAQAPGEAPLPLSTVGPNAKGEPAWSRMGGDQLGTYAVELSKLGRYDELLEIAAELNNRELYDLASTFAWQATKGKENDFAAWFERAFALSHLGRQEEAITAFRRAYSLQAKRPHYAPDITVPVGTRIVAFAGAGSGRHYHGMGLTPDGVVALNAKSSFVTTGSLSETGTILDSPANRLTTYILGMGGASRWIALAFKFESESAEAKQALTEGALSETNTSILVDIGAALNARQRYFDAVTPLSEAIRRETTHLGAWFEYAYALAHDTSRAVEAVAAFMHVKRLAERLATGEKPEHAVRIKMPQANQVSIFTGIGGGTFYHGLENQPGSVCLVTRDGAITTIRGDDVSMNAVHVPTMDDIAWVGMASK